MALSQSYTLPSRRANTDLLCENEADEKVDSLGGHGVLVLQVGQVALVLRQPLLMTGNITALATQVLQLTLQLYSTHCTQRKEQLTNEWGCLDRLAACYIHTTATHGNSVMITACGCSKHQHKFMDEL